MTVYLELGDYCEVAAELLGTAPEQIARLQRIALADSVLATARAGFGGQDAYPTLVEKAAVLVEHLATDVPMVEKIAAGKATPNGIIRWLEGRTASK